MSQGGEKYSSFVVFEALMGSIWCYLYVLIQQHKPTKGTHYPTTNNCGKVKGEVAKQLAKRHSLFELRIDRAFHMVRFKTQMNQAKIRKEHRPGCVLFERWYGWRSLNIATRRITGIFM
jgi:hypothetical protein